MTKAFVLAIMATLMASAQACGVEHISSLRDYAATEEGGRMLRGNSISGTYCELAEQSPINLPSLPSVQTLTPEQAYSAIEIEYEDVDHGHWVLENLGGTIEMVPENITILVRHNSLAYMEGRSSDVNMTYQVAQFHFHWDTSFTGYGSEHTRGMDSYPIEMHIVTFNTKYGDISTAAGNPDGLLVIGVFGKKTTSKNAQFEKIVDTIVEAEESDAGFLKDAEVEVEEFSLEEMLSSVDLAKYDTYKGSLTTPSCNQVVTWVVMHDELRLSRSQIQTFQDAHKDDDTKIAPNYREVLPRNGRAVFRSQNLCKSFNCRMESMLNQLGL